MESSMKTKLSFEDAETKKLLSKLDFIFFLKRNLSQGKYNPKDINSIYLSHDKTLNGLRLERRSNKKQFNYFLEGQVRKMFNGGFLPALFELDGTKRLTLFDFSAVGESWAYFECWRNYYKLKMTTERIWGIIIKVGSVAGILLSLIKLAELTFKLHF
jgi:hypothetical protein